MFVDDAQKVRTDHVYGTTPTESELEGIKELFKRIKSSPEYKKTYEEYLTTVNGHRFLAARNYNISKSFGLLMSHLKWRFDDFKPHEILPSQVEQFAVKGAVQASPRGHDKFGRPMLILDNSKEFVKITDKKEKQKQGMRHLVFNMERCFNFFPTPSESENISESKSESVVNRYVLFINLEDFKILSAPPFGTTKETLNILTSQYPERLGLAVMYRPPWMFHKFFNAFKMFIDKKTREKVRFMSGDFSTGSSNDLELSALIGDDWKVKTGVAFPKKEKDMAAGYDHQVYWKQVEQDFAESVSKSSV